MERKLWRPAPGFNIDEKDKHCGNCLYGTVNQHAYKQYKKTGVYNKGTFASCPKNAKAVRLKNKQVMIISNCSGAKNIYSEKTITKK